MRLITHDPLCMMYAIKQVMVTTISIAIVLHIKFYSSIYSYIQNYFIFKTIANLNEIQKYGKSIDINVPSCPVRS